MSTVTATCPRDVKAGSSRLGERVTVLRTTAAEKAEVEEEREEKKKQRDSTHWAGGEKKPQ